MSSHVCLRKSLIYLMRYYIPTLQRSDISYFSSCFSYPVFLLDTFLNNDFHRHFIWTHSPIQSLLPALFFNSLPFLLFKGSAFAPCHLYYPINSKDISYRSGGAQRNTFSDFFPKDFIDFLCCCIVSVCSFNQTKDVHHTSKVFQTFLLFF